ncbi:MAG TPA: aconitase family protein [Burkholderiaceae bacterium]|nr:aconitase family protein [Burkholderiaceae bacterium]
MSVHGLTLTEKVLARCANLPEVRAGDEVRVRPDFVHAYELKGTTDVIERDMPIYGPGKVVAPERYAVFIDHRVPAKLPEQEALHEKTRQWCKKYGMALFDRRGIGHQVASEEGYAIPGSFAVHLDGHISQLGAFGALAIGVRGNVFEAFVSETINLRVPGTTRVILNGSVPHGVSGRDVFNHLLYLHGPQCAAFDVLEFCGPGASTISVEDRQTICGLAMFTGAVSAVFDPVDQYCIEYPKERAPAITLQRSDENAAFTRTFVIDLNEVEPMIVLPPSPANARPLNDHLGIPLTTGYLGSCASGRLTDLRVAARILAGKTLPPGFSLHVVPTSQKIMAEAASDGTLATLIEAGAFLSSPSCDFCSGNIATMASGQTAISTGTLNVPGRMGAVDADIYLASAATLAASALRGRITDPREFLVEQS